MRLCNSLISIVKSLFENLQPTISKIGIKLTPDLNESLLIIL